MHPSELFSDVRTERVRHSDYHSASWEILSNSRLTTFRRNPQEYYQRFVTQEIEGDDKECLRFGRVFHEAVLEPRTEITRDNVITGTLGIFRVCGTPVREPDMIEDDWSQTWYQDLPEPGVVRRASTWGELADGRTWLLNPERQGQFQSGFCAYADMLRDGDHFRSIRSDVLSKTGARSGQDWKDFLKSVPQGTVTYKPAEWFDLLAMRRELRAHPLARQILFGEPNPGRQTEFTIKGIDRETGVQIQTRLDFCQEFIDGVVVVDLKSSRDASPSCWRRQAERDGLHVQAAIQIGLATLLFGTEVTFRFVVVQKDAPYRVEVFELEDEFIEIGVEDYLRDIRRFAECQSTGIWQPTKYGEVQTLKTPPYRMLDRQLAWRTPDGGTGFSDDGYTED